MRLPRFRVRTLIVAVAMTATALGAWRLWQAREVYRAKALEYASDEARYLRWARAVAAGKTYPMVLKQADLESWSASLQRQAAQFHRLREKYERAAPYPFLPVAPDPPPPE